MKKMTKQVFVGMSGGVDSSLTAALLVEQGYKVTGVYMKNWAKDLPGFQCPWRQDYLDAKRVAVQLGIDFQVFDFQKEYFDRVVNYLIEGFKSGITPNPDIICNQEIKFKLFYETALSKGADYIATGHYARVQDGKLLQAVDQNKDQTYFLYRLKSSVLQRTIFPLGEFTKPEVRRQAQKRGLITAGKKESMGICFVGKVGIREFLTAELSKTPALRDKYLKPGPIIDQNNQVVGQHQGAIFYTIGQRHGLNIGGGLPYYVTSKNIAKNQVFVTSVIDSPELWSSKIQLTEMHWINDQPNISELQNLPLEVRTRHRAPLVSCRLKNANQDQFWSLELEHPIRAVTPGQSAVLYQGDVCLGGGIIT